MNDEDIKEIACRIWPALQGDFEKYAEFARTIGKAARAEMAEEAATMASIYLADHRIEEAREELPDAVRAVGRIG